MNTDKDLTDQLRDSFVDAGWAFATSSLSQFGAVPDAVLLGIYASQELVQCLPASQDRTAFFTAVADQARAHGADIAVQVTQLEVAIAEAAPVAQPAAKLEAVVVTFRERGQAIHAQIAYMDGGKGLRILGPRSNFDATQAPAGALDSVFGSAIVH